MGVRDGLERRQGGVVEFGAGPDSAAGQGIGEHREELAFQLFRASVSGSHRCFPLSWPRPATASVAGSAMVRESRRPPERWRIRVTAWLRVP
jgi:hypothetical protein